MAAYQYVYHMDNLAKTYPGGKKVFDGISLHFLPDAKIGVVGVNGAGKSTLLRIMAGQDTDFAGEAWAEKGVRVGYLPQEPQLDADKTVWENVAEGSEDKQIYDAYNAIAMKLAEDYSDELMEEMTALQEEVDTRDAWDIDAKIEMAMGALRCPPADADVTNLSGGEKRRVAICRLLLSKPHVLLLDEPTNHLDAESVAWLQMHLEKYQGVVLIVTHDRYFLDSITTWTLELDRGKGVPYQGGYSSWLEQKTKRLAQESREESAKQRALSRELDWIRASPKARQAKSKARIKSYEEKRDEADREKINHTVINIPPGPRLGGNVVDFDHVSKGFEDKLLIQDLDFKLPPGGVVGVIGPNGAGKTTVLNMISGFYTPDTGSIELKEDIAGRPAYRMARAGIARTYQTTQLFENLSVRENILIALGTGRLGFILGGAPRAEAVTLADDLLSFVGYTGAVARRAGDLPHVDKRLVEIARALATRPSTLLLDEPAAGLMHSDKAALSTLILKIAEAGVAVVLVEHDMSLLMSISDEIIVLDAGLPIKAGTPAEVQNDPDVRRAYLGDSAYQGRSRPEPRAHGHEKEVLSTRALTAGYGAAAALDNVDVSVEPGEMGANGAGKSTMMRALSGLHRPVAGAIFLDLARVEDLPASKIAHAGLSLVPEGRQVFPLMSVRDNILMGAYTRDDLDSVAEVEALLARFPRLRDRIDMPAGLLSGGEQQMLAIARGLIANPRILLLDEPSLGLAPSIIAELYDVLADLRDEGVTVLLVDQMATLALAVADRAYVLENGRVVRSGSSEELRQDASIEAAYLGGGVAAE